ncbi:2-oxo-4-hydroxy-4-carboxy-5-ureidoimidazoline decarboxylase [Aeromonas cavernicola]|uniref:2-oxo-4-hydroxy-4-carboxy-5-ureidoimidazoline decarboxylase n=1 Tax=Aeromonas cavernicola TaxID=1006623 RepID=A0A2H9U570_9GAMM|nr:2-oxo-4-hydroxy-4-carboxy-5-ureidoimidazoline decarboxylase [Aeromonas cavernicola]PJG59175.1 OHCU decarboxylase [Aeromonas cavernicola]
MMLKKVVLTSALLFTAVLPMHSYGANPAIYINDLNKGSQAEFESALSKIFERAPWAIESVAAKRPFKGFVDLYENIILTIKNAGPETQMTLIKSHPDLACKGIRPAEITQHSENEQGGAGLNECSPEEASKLAELNKTYKAKFGFPFMLAIKGFNRTEMIEQLEQRINNDRQQEFDTALQQIYKVVMWRLSDTVK